MYWCNNCQKAYSADNFKVVDAWEEDTVIECKTCGSDDIDIADKCPAEGCDEWKSPNKELCEWCEADVKEALNNVMETIKQRYSIDDDWKAKEKIKSRLDETYGE